jgi:hypothetical protein
MRGRIQTSGTTAPTAGHIAWDDIRHVQCKGQELKIDSRLATFVEWSVFGFRWPWPWLERKLGYRDSCRKPRRSRRG